MDKLCVEEYINLIGKVVYIAPKLHHMILKLHHEIPAQAWNLLLSMKIRSSISLNVIYKRNRSFIKPLYTCLQQDMKSNWKSLSIHSSMTQHQTFDEILKIVYYLKYMSQDFALLLKENKININDQETLRQYGVHYEQCQHQILLSSYPIELNAFLQCFNGFNN